MKSSSCETECPTTCLSRDRRQRSNDVRGTTTSTRALHLQHYGGGFELLYELCQCTAKLKYECVAGQYVSEQTTQDEGRAI